MSGAITAAASIASGTVFVGSNNGYEDALNESTGALRWRYDTRVPITVPSTLSGPDVIVASGDSQFFLIQRSGAVDQTTTASDTVVGTAGAENFDGVELADGAIRGYRPITNGNIIGWETSLPTTLSSSPTVVNGEVFVTGNDGTVQCWTVPGSPAV